MIYTPNLEQHRARLPSITLSEINWGVSEGLKGKSRSFFRRLLLSATAFGSMLGAAGCGVPNQIESATSAPIEVIQGGDSEILRQDLQEKIYNSAQEINSLLENDELPTQVFMEEAYGDIVDLIHLEYGGEINDGVSLQVFTDKKEYSKVVSEKVGFSPRGPAVVAEDPDPETGFPGRSEILVDLTFLKFLKEKYPELEPGAVLMGIMFDEAISAETEAIAPSKNIRGFDYPGGYGYMPKGSNIIDFIDGFSIGLNGGFQYLRQFEEAVVALATDELLKSCGLPATYEHPLTNSYKITKSALKYLIEQENIDMNQLVEAMMVSNLAALTDILSLDLAKTIKLMELFEAYNATEEKERWFTWATSEIDQIFR